MVQGGDNGGSPSLQEEKYHDGKGEVGDPGSGDTASDAVSSSPTAHSENQETNTLVQFSKQVEQFCALDRHPVVNIQYH